MTKGITVKRQIHFRRGRSNRMQVLAGTKPKVLVGGAPRVSRLMALAIRFDQRIRDGVVRDQAELARLGRVSRARLTQIMNLTGLAPDIQEAILFQSAEGQRRNLLTERHLRRIVAELSWKKQRDAWYGTASTIAKVRP
jgi:hypothetical protein